MATIDPRTGTVIPSNPLGAPILPGAGQNGPFAGPVQQQFAGPQQAPQPFVPPTGLIGSEQALQGGLAGALAGLQQGQTGINTQLSQARSGVLGQINQGVGGLQPFVRPGQQAQDRQAALSGALGPAAQQAAFATFMESPGQAFLRERGDLAVTRNAAALGGLGGGRVQQELQRQGIGLAAQDFSNSFGRLGQVADRGLGAAGAIGSLRGQGAGILGQIGQTGASLLGQLGSQAGGFAFDTGRLLSSGRTRAGEQIAGQVGGTTSALSNLIQQQGIGLSGLFDQSGGNLAALLQGAGTGIANDQNAQAALLAQIAQGSAGAAAGLPGLPGTQQTGGILGGLGQLAAGAGGLISGLRTPIPGG